MGVGAAEQELLPGETQLGLPSLYPAPANAAGGAIVYLLSPSADDLGESVVFNLRIVDLSRSATSAGTEIPVVRDRDLYASTIHLLNIPTDARFRLALRVFEMNHDGAKFAVRIFDQTTNSLLATRIITTIVDVPPRRFTPAFAEVADLLSGASAPAQIRIEIEPLTAAVAFWAYVSVTNNDSQQITLVTPQ